MTIPPTTVPPSYPRWLWQMSLWHGSGMRRAREPRIPPVGRQDLGSDQHFRGGDQGIDFTTVLAKSVQSDTGESQRVATRLRPGPVRCVGQSRTTMATGGRNA